MLTFFDCTCMIGRCSDRATSLPTTSELLLEMGHHNIGQALVSHAFSRDFEIEYGNEMLVRNVGERDNLYPVLTACPWVTNRVMWSDETQTLLRDKAFGMRLFPVRHRFDLSDSNLRAVMLIADAIQLPVLLDYDQINNTGGFKDLMERYPNVPFILSGVGVDNHRFIYPLLASHPNLHVETSLCREYRGLERLAEHFGVERILFGSGMPFLDTGASVFRVAYATLDQDDKEKLACRNLQAIISKVRN